MTKTRSILLGLLVAFAMGAIAPALASAHAFFIEGSEVTKGKNETQAVTTFTKLESTVAGTKVLIECEGDFSSGNLEEKGKTTGEGKLKECVTFETKKGKEEPLTTCEFKEPIEYKYKDALIAAGEDEIKPEGTEETLVEMEVKTCALKGKYKLKGVEVCGLLEAEIEMIDHEITCIGPGSKLKLGTEPAALNSDGTIKLTSSKGWFTN